MDDAAFLAMNRFGFGRRPEERLPSDPHGWLRTQLAGPDPAPTTGAIDTAGALAIVVEQQQARKSVFGEMPPSATAGGAQAGAKLPRPVGMLAAREAHDLLGCALMTPSPFRERLVWFWANHFTVANRATVTSACSGAYVREAIRPNVTGQFSDMLVAVIRHPAMLAYLNQAQSAGPESVVGLRRHRGLNENLARECLELHTVTPASGYTQADVTNFARVLTGWSIELHDEPRGFRFRPKMHEPGEIEVMGRVWPPGEEGGLALLNWLGTHPSTYRHLATKLVCHFVADDPPPDQVRRIETVLRDTRGDLGAAAEAVIELPGAWETGTKLRPPQDFLVFCLRSVGATPDKVPNLANIAGSLGQGVFQAPFPIGWPDRAADWAGPEAMVQRVDFSYGLAGREAAIDPEQLGHATLGPLLTQQTLSQIRAAGSRRDALTLLLASPEFQRR